jgi:hypothetical protein
VTGSAIEGMGDGLLVSPDATGMASATVTASQFVRCARAGMLFSNAGGAVSGSWATDNAFGLVLQKGANPMVGADNVFKDNKQKDRDDAGMLSAP